jgi:hypothetical protein
MRRIVEEFFHSAGPLDWLVIFLAVAVIVAAVFLIRHVLSRLWQ